MLVRALCILAIALASHARGDDRPTFHADIGFAGERTTGWTPIRVWITGGDRAIDGTVVVEHDQDATQGVRLVAPFATTPGETVAVELASFFPQSLRSLRLTLLDRGGTPLGTVRYSSTSSDALPLPAETPTNFCRLLSVGSHSLGSTFADRSDSISLDRRLSFADTTPSGEPDLARWRNLGELAPLLAPSLPVGDLATTRVAYEQVDAVVVSGESASKADPRAIAAILGWVEQGGRLVIVADDMTPHWRSWLPAGDAGDLVVLDDLRPTEPPGALRFLYGPGRVGSLGGPDEPPEPTPPDQSKDDVPGESPGADSAIDLPAVAESFPARAISLTERARRDGWRVRWAIDGTRGLIAEGPLAHGWITIVGVDPRATSSILARAAHLRVWPSVIGNAVGDAIGPAVKDRFGEELWSSQVDTSAIELLASGEPPDIGAFVAIISLLLLTALALGPIDYFGLKALRLRHRSWLTAIGWIGVASVIAYGGPRLVRVSTSRFSRLECVDRVLDPGAPGGAPGRAAIHAVSGHYAGKSGRVDLTHEHEDSWWHGISAETYWGEAPGAMVMIAQQPSGLSGPPPSGRLDSFSTGVWTFRTFADDTAGEVRFTGRAWRGSDGAWRAAFAGLAPGARVEHAVIRLGEDQWFGLAEVDGEFVEASEAFDGSNWRSERLKINEYGTRWPSDPRPYFDAFESVSRRERALEARLVTGRWAALYAVVKDDAPSTRVGGAQEHSRILLLRLQVPIEAMSDAPDEPRAESDAP